MKRYIKSAISDLFDEDDQTLIGIACNPNTDPEVLAHLATHPGRYIRQLVAENPNTSAETLLLLSADRDKTIKLAVVENENAPLSALCKVFNCKIRDYDFWYAVVSELCWHPNADDRLRAKAEELYREYSDAQERARVRIN